MKQRPSTVPVTVTGTAGPAGRMSTSAARLNFTFNVFPTMLDGPDASTGTVPLSSTEETSIWLAVNGSDGSMAPETQRPWDFKFSVLGDRSNVTATGHDSTDVHDFPSLGAFVGVALNVTVLVDG